MEQDHDPVLLFKNNVSEILKDLAYFGQKIQEKSQNLLEENESNVQLDINNLEYVTLQIASLMKKVKGNMIAVINTLRSHIKYIDDNSSDKLFEQVMYELDCCQKAEVKLGPNNQYLFEDPCDKGTMSDDYEQTKNCSTVNKGISDQTDISTSDYKKESLCSESTSIMKYFNLGLKKRPNSCKSEDTDDSWTDSLCRGSLIEDVSKSDAQAKVGDEINLGDEDEIDSKGPCESQHFSASPRSDSASTIITDYKQEKLLKKVDAEGNNITLSEDNVFISPSKSETDSQITITGNISSAGQTVLCTSPNSLQSVPTEVVPISPIIAAANNINNYRTELSEFDSQETVIIDSTVKEATVIGTDETTMQQTENKIVNISETKRDLEMQMSPVSVVAKDSSKTDPNRDHDNQGDNFIESSWSLETAKLDSDDENTPDPVDNKSSNEIITNIEVSEKSDTCQLSVDSDETDILNSCNPSSYDVEIDNVSCHSEILTDTLLLENSNESYEFDILDDSDYYNKFTDPTIKKKDKLSTVLNANTSDSGRRPSSEITLDDVIEDSTKTTKINIENGEIVCEIPSSSTNTKGHINDNGEARVEEEKFLLSAVEENKEDILKVEESLSTVPHETSIIRDFKEELNMYSNNSLGDDLLELLREVEVPCMENERKVTISNSNQSINSDSECEAAEEILNMFELESSDNLSDSETTNSDSIYIDGLSSDDNSNSNNIQKVVTESPPNIEDKINILNYLKLKEMRLDDCFVSLERLQPNNEKIQKYKNILGTSIDRLCDLNNLVSKRKRESGSNEDCSKHKIWKKRKKRLTEIELENSESDSDVQITENRSSTPYLPEHLEKKLDDFIEKSLDDLEHSDQSQSSSDETDDNAMIGIRTINKTSKNKRDLSMEERRKKSWRNVSLLTENLSSNSDSSSSTSSSESDSSGTKKNKISTRNRKIANYERDSDFHISSSSDSSASSSRDGNITRINKTTSSKDSSDSDVTFVAENKVSDIGLSCQKGRRNIRALMSEKNLAAETQLAHKEEEERINRLEDRVKLRDTFTQSAKESSDQSMSWSQSEDFDDPFVLDFDDKTGQPLIRVHPRLTKRLKPHQKDGIQFMWDSCYESMSRLKEHSGSGCILAHCMGLGKTYQVLALAHTLFSHEVTETKHILVVCPLSTVNSWKQEAKITFKGLPEDKFCILTIADKKEISQKYNIVKKWYFRKKGMLVLGYEAFSTIINTSKLDKIDSKIKTYILKALVDPGPDLVICDEGHLLKNKTSLKTQALNRIKTKRRIMLTGTPLQNNLDEYYYMVQFVKPNLLGNIKEFKTNFINPITNGQYEDSTKEDIKLMKKRTHILFKLLKKTIQRVEDTVLKTYLPKIIDHALFIQLHSTQIELYDQYSKLCQEKRMGKKNRSGFLADFRVFQYIGTHPQLLSVAEKLKSKKIKERDVITEEEENLDCDLDGWWKSMVPEDASNRIELGTKLVVFKAIIEECEEVGDKVLVFSQSLPELDLIEHFLKTVGTKKSGGWQKKVDYCRMDGTVQPEIRTYICDKFNDRNNYKLRILLMSTKVGGLGLNLTAANRIIIMTVNWNPSYDTQSVFRAYRFGQEKPVYVYRLISLGTMEEKVYQRTVTKLAIAHRVVDKHQITRHYQRTDLEELYSCKPTADEERPTPYVPEDKLLAKLILDLPIIFKYHEHQALLVNNPADDLSEQEKIAAWEEFEKEKTVQAQRQQPVQASTSVPTSANGPTFNMAFNLSRNICQVKPSPINIQHIHCTDDLFPVTPSSSAKGTQNFIPLRLPYDTTISIEDGPNPSSTTVSNRNIETAIKKNSLQNLPLNLKTNASHNKINNPTVYRQRVNDEEVNKSTSTNSVAYDKLDIQKQSTNDGNIVQPLRSIDTSINLTNILKSSSNLMVVNPVSEERSLKIVTENSQIKQKRKSNSAIELLLDQTNETRRYIGQPIDLSKSNPIILVEEDVAVKNNTTCTGDVITLD